MSDFKRKRIRWRGFDYSTAATYFLTICVEGRRCILCEKDPNVKTPLGEKVDELINEAVAGNHCLRLVKYVVMPNHIHLLLSIDTHDSAPTIVMFVRYFKRLCTERLGYSLWQRSFFDHVTRDEREQSMIWDYIDRNPRRWAEDKLNPDCNT